MLINLLACFDYTD